MKKYIIYSLIMTLTCGLGACNNDEDVDKANSIFSTEEVDRNPFDKWILGNYTHPYNIALKYRMEDNESDMTHILAPAEYKKSDRKSTRLNSSHEIPSRMPSSA